MAQTEVNLDFVNFLLTLERKLGEINSIITDSYQHQDMNEEDILLLEKLHGLYYRGEVSFGQGNLDTKQLKVL